MRLRILVMIVLALCAGCAGRSAPEEHLSYASELIDGGSLFGETIPPAPVMDLLWVSPEMEAFVDRHVTEPSFGYSRFRRLMVKMIRNEFFIDQYERYATYSAARTFATQKGNCLAYTNLFVALARQAGLDASYQLVRIRPTWDVESGFLIRNNHVNVRLEHVRMPGFSDGEITVDFNNVEADSSTPRRKISDEYAASMFYANIAIDYLHAGDHKSAFAYTKRAILTESNNVDLWNNLGALYSIFGLYSQAQAVYETAMRLDRHDKTAIAGMAKSLRAQGKLVDAERYARLALKYRRRNPYYFYAVAEQAFHNDAFEEAMAAVNRAIDLQRKNSRFYALRAATARQLGDDELVERSIKLQRKHDKAGAGSLNLREFNFD